MKKTQGPANLEEAYTTAQAKSHQRPNPKNRQGPFRQDGCYNFGKQGHFARDSRNGSRNRNPRRYPNRSGSGNVMFQSQRWSVRMQAPGQKQT